MTLDEKDGKIKQMTGGAKERREVRKALSK